MDGLSKESLTTLYDGNNKRPKLIVQKNPLEYIVPSLIEQTYLLSV